MRRIPSIVRVLVLAATAGVASPILTLIPAGGGVSGSPGATVGWGYTLANDSATDWFVPSSLNSGAFLYATPALLFDFPTLAPGSGVSVAFDVANGFGLFQLTIDGAAPSGFVNAGLFAVGGEWWTGDPLMGGTFIGAAQDLQAPYSASVSDVPEPMSANLVALGMLAVWYCAPRSMGKGRSK